MINIKPLISIVGDAVSDFASNAGDKTPAEWLQGYLSAKLPEKSVEAIRAISGEILATLDILEQKKASLEAAVESGQSAENWLTADIMAESGGNGEKARSAAAFFNGIASAEKSFDESIEADLIDVSEESEAWQDNNWNDYKLKDTLKGLAASAGRAGLQEVASEVFLKASREGLGTALTDKGFILDTLANGAATGLKTAVSAGLTVAEASGVIPSASIKVLTTTAFKTVESMKAFGDVIKGKATVTEALVKIKNTAVATFSGMWKQHKGQVLKEVKDKVGQVFGPLGAAVSGAITGLCAEPRDEPKLVTVVKEAGKAALNWFTNKLTKVNFIKNKVLSFLNF